MPTLFPSKAKPEEEDGGAVPSVTEGGGEGFAGAKEGCGVGYMVSMQVVKEGCMLSRTREQRKAVKFNWVTKDLLKRSSVRTSAFSGQNFLSSYFV